MDAANITLLKWYTVFGRDLRGGYVGHGETHIRRIFYGGQKVASFMAKALKG